MKKWEKEDLFEKAILLSSQNGQSVESNALDLKGAQRALGMSETPRREDLKEILKQFNEAHNTVTIDRGLLRDAHRELGELISLLGDDDERRRKIMLSLSFALNKDR